VLQHRLNHAACCLSTALQRVAHEGRVEVPQTRRRAGPAAAAAVRVGLHALPAIRKRLSRRQGLRVYVRVCVCVL
jgi:hypothetical protein